MSPRDTTPRVTTTRRRARAAVLSGAAAVALTAAGLTVAHADPAPRPADCAIEYPADRPDTELSPVDTAALDSLLAGLPDDTDASAALVDISGTESWRGAGGVENLSTGEPADLDNRFRIGSITKVFNTAIMLQLVDEGRVDLDDEVAELLPELLPADYPAVTVGQLLDHTSGLPSPWIEGADEFAWQYEHRFDHVDTVSFLRSGFEQPPLFTPGTAQEYSNVNSMVAALIVEQVTGDTWEHQLQRRIARPLALDDTYAPAEQTHIRGGHQHGYQLVDGEPVDTSVWNQSITRAAGDMVSSVDDLRRFTTALFAGEVVPPSQLDHMFTVPRVPTWDHDADPCNDVPAALSMGLERLELPDGTVVWGKTGARPGYASAFGGTRDGGRLLVYSVNSYDAKGVGQLDNPVTAGVIAAAFGL